MRELNLVAEEWRVRCIRVRIWCRWRDMVKASLLEAAEVRKHNTTKGLVTWENKRTKNWISHRKLELADRHAHQWILRRCFSAWSTGPPPVQVQIEADDTSEP